MIKFFRNFLALCFYFFCACFTMGAIASPFNILNGILFWSLVSMCLNGALAYCCYLAGNVVSTPDFKIKLL